VFVNYDFKIIDK